MKTYVVNMLKDTAKRAQIEAQLAEHPELDYHIWKAVEGRELSEEEQMVQISPDFFVRYGKEASLPAAGCSLSHNGIYKDMVNNNLPYALILEDDAKLSNDLQIDAYEHLLSSTNAVAILLTSDFWYLTRDWETAIDDRYKIYKLTDGYMTSGYLINKAGAELLSKLNFPVHYTADAWKVFIEAGISLYGVVPHLISFPDGLGEIGMAGNVPQTPAQKIRSKLAMVYMHVIELLRYFKGVRKSKKLW